MPYLRCVLVTVLASTESGLVGLGCGGAGDAPRRDTTVSVPPATPPGAVPETAVSSGWDASAGPVLLVASARPDLAIVVYPEIQGEYAVADLQFDTARVRGARATLVDRAGQTATGTLAERISPGDEEDCVGWPTLRLVTPSGAPAPWRVGFLAPRLVPIVLDSIGSLSPKDSAALVAEVARLASTVPVRAAAARLRGLPFSVQDVWRFRIAPGIDGIVARVVRNIHQEASPIEERTLLIAERDSAEEHLRRYTLVFHERAVGEEETLEGNEILAALKPPDASRPMIILARESEGGLRYTVLGRTGPRSWEVTWTSALVRC
jgi:hypothetical protein